MGIAASIDPGPADQRWEFLQLEALAGQREGLVCPEGVREVQGPAGSREVTAPVIADGAIMPEPDGLLVLGLGCFPDPGGNYRGLLHGGSFLAPPGAPGAP